LAEGEGDDSDPAVGLVCCGRRDGGREVGGGVIVAGRVAERVAPAVVLRESNLVYEVAEDCRLRATELEVDAELDGREGEDKEDPEADGRVAEPREEREDEDV